VQPAPIAGEIAVIFAKDQPEYIPLPASVDAAGVVTTEWMPTDEERDHLLTGGALRTEVFTFGQNVQVDAIERYVALRTSVDAQGCVTTDWEPAEHELMRLFAGGSIRIQHRTQMEPLQPIRVSVAPPECGFRGGR
jgi:hypothetical protein